MFGRYNLFIGYADLDSDGVNELIVYPENRQTCGTAGCETYVYYQDKKLVWRELFFFYAQTDENGVPLLCLTPPDRRGYRNIYSAHSQLCWESWVFTSSCPPRETAPSTKLPQ